MACAAAVREQAVPTRGMATTRRSSTGTFSEATSPAARALLTQQHRAAGVGVGGTSLFRSPTLLAAETSPAPLSYGAGHGAAASGAAAGAAGKRKARSPFVAGSPGPLRSMARAPAMVAALAHALRLIAEDGMLVVPADAVKRGLSTAAPEEHPLATVFEAEERAVELGTVDEEKVPCGPEEGEESEGDDPLGDPATWRSPEFVTLPPVGSAEQQRHMKAAKQLRGALSSLPRAMKGGAGGKSPASSSDVGHRAGVRVTFDSAARAAARTYAAQLESVLVPGQPLPLHEQGEDLLSSLLRYYSRLAFNPVRQSVYFNAHDTREVYRKAWRDPELREVLLSNGIDLTEEMGTAVEGEGDDGQMQGQAGGVDAAAAPASPPAARSGLDEGALDAAAVDDVADEDFELDGEAESPQPQALRNLNERWRREHQEELRAADAESPCTPRGRRVCRAPGDVVPARAGSPAASPRPGHRQARTQPLVGAQAGPSAAAARFQPAGAAAAAGEKKEEEGENEEDVWVQLVTIQGREAPGNIGNMLGVGGDADLAFNAEDVSALLHHALLQRARLLRLLDAGKDGLVLAAPSHGRGLRRTWAAKLRAAATVLAQKAEAARAQGQGPRLPRADRPCEGLWSALQDALDAVPCAVEDELVAARALAEEEGATGDPSDGMDNAKEELALSGDEGASPSLVEGDRGGGAGYDTESFRAEEVEAWAAECRVGFRTAHRFMSQLFSCVLAIAPPQLIRVHSHSPLGACTAQNELRPHCAGGGARVLAPPPAVRGHRAPLCVPPGGGVRPPARHYAAVCAPCVRGGCRAVTVGECVGLCVLTAPVPCAEQLCTLHGARGRAVRAAAERAGRAGTAVQRAQAEPALPQRRTAQRGGQAAAAEEAAAAPAPRRQRARRGHVRPLHRPAVPGGAGDRGGRVHGRADARRRGAVCGRRRRRAALGSAQAPVVVLAPPYLMPHEWQVGSNATRESYPKRRRGTCRPVSSFTPASTGTGLRHGRRAGRSRTRPRRQSCPGCTPWRPHTAPGTAGRSRRGRAAEWGTCGSAAKAVHLGGAWCVLGRAGDGGGGRGQTPRTRAAGCP